MTLVTMLTEGSSVPTPQPIYGFRILRTEVTVRGKKVSIDTLQLQLADGTWQDVPIVMGV